MYLSEHKFSGEVKFWFESGELRRSLVSVFTGDVDANGTRATSLEKFLPKIEDWLSNSDSPIKVMFRGGEIRRVET